MDSSGKSRKISFATPLIAISASVLIIAFTFQAFYILGILRDNMNRLQEENFSLVTQSMASMIELEIEGNERELYGFTQAISTAADDMELTDPILEDSMNKLLLSLHNSNEFYDVVFVSDMDGRVVWSTEDNIIGADITSREYFREITEEGHLTYTTKNALISKVDGQITIVHAAAIINKGKMTGLLGTALNLTRFGNSHILSKVIGESGYPYLADGTGLTLVHPAEEKVDTMLQEIDPLFIDVVDRNVPVQYLHYALEGVGKLGVFVRIPSLNWIVAMAINEDEAFSVIAEIRIRFILSNALLILVAGFLLFLYVHRRLVKKVRSVEQIMLLASQGSLVERGTVRGNDEIAGMAGSLNSLLDSLSSFFGDLTVNLENLEEVGTDLSSHMEETSAAVHQIRTNVESSLHQIEIQEASVNSTAATVEQITQNIRSLDQNIDRQNENIAQGSTAVEEMIAQIKAVSSSTEQADRIMKSLSDTSERGKKNIQDISVLIEDISEQSKELEQANALIAGIAAQTNLLAMNAAIEAAHAGESGRGFSVVADEIRKLAEQSTVQSAQVKETISRINGRIDEAVAGSGESSQSFEEVLTHMREMETITGEIKSSMEEQVAGSTQVLESLSTLKNVGQEVSAGSGEMTDGNRNILEAVEQLTQISNQVSLAFREINHGMDEINQSVLAISGLTEKNRVSIDAVRSEASRYKRAEDSREFAEIRPFIEGEMEL